MRTNLAPRRDLEAQVAKLEADKLELELKLEVAERERRRWFQEAQALAARVSPPAR